MKAAVLLFGLLECLVLHGLPSQLNLNVGMSQTIRFPGVSHVSVGNSTLARVRAIPPNELLVTGLVPGVTTLWIWPSRGDATSVLLMIRAPEASPSVYLGTGAGIVRVALEFLEMDSQNSSNFGIDWPDVIQFGANANLSGTSGLNYSAQFSTAKGLIHHLVKDGQAQVIARPDLYVRLGEEAIFQSGGEFAVPSSIESSGHLTKHIEWKPYGISLRVRPTSHDMLSIHSDVKLEISELDRSQNIEGIPGLLKRNLETKISVREGETAILSGLSRQQSQVASRRLPILGEIPFLGDLLFGTTSKGTHRSEVMTAITFTFLTDRVRRETLERNRRKLGGNFP